MSRRRSSDGLGWASINLPGTGWQRVVVVCTGRETHRRREFGWVWVPPPHIRGSERIRTEQLREYSEFFAGESDENPGVVRQHSRTFGFGCPLCDRDVPILRARFERLVEKLADEGTSAIDISAPPATLGGNSI